MKVPLPHGFLLDLDAPTVAAYDLLLDNGAEVWLIDCPHCGEPHAHGPGEGHRIAHCTNPASPYRRTGYNLAYAGEWMH